MQPKDTSKGSVFFTFKQMGNIMRVTAIDEKTGREVIISAPINLSQAEMQTLAYNRLQFVLSKQTS